jgi:hypothetical protein
MCGVALEKAAPADRHKRSHGVELADIVRRHGRELLDKHQFPPHHLKVLRRIGASKRHER